MSTLFLILSQYTVSRAIPCWMKFPNRLIKRMFMNANTSLPSCFLTHHVNLCIHGLWLKFPSPQSLRSINMKTLFYTSSFQNEQLFNYKKFSFFSFFLLLIKHTSEIQLREFLAELIA
jgi:hypothetical protein